jgi:uncharacterized membrane protein YccF (DUF307 family)
LDLVEKQKVCLGEETKMTDVCTVDETLFSIILGWFLVVGTIVSFLPQAIAFIV